MKAKYQIAPSKAVIGVDRPVYTLSTLYEKSFRMTKGNISNRIGPCPLLFFIKSICLVDMNLFASLDEIPTMTLQDNMETKRYGRTCVPFRITKGNISNRTGPWPLLFY